MNKSTIICGSKKSNANLDKLVDSFQTIVRNNMLINGVGYGERESDIQVLNCHTYQHYHDRDFSGYSHLTTKDVVDAFKEYTLSASSEFITHPRNNTHLMRQTILKHQIPVEIHKELRCGLSHVSKCISQGIKPFIVGFSLNNVENENHQVNTLAVNKNGHEVDIEFQIIIHLHNKKLIDASFCTIVGDADSIKLDTSIIQPTKEAVDILKKCYGKIELISIISNKQNKQNG